MSKRLSIAVFILTAMTIFSCTSLSRSHNKSSISPPLEVITFYDSVMFIHRNASLRITDSDNYIKPFLQGIVVEVTKNSGVFVYKDIYYIADASRLSQATIFTKAPFINPGNCDIVSMEKAYLYLSNLE